MSNLLWRFSCIIISSNHFSCPIHQIKVNITWGNWMIGDHVTESVPTHVFRNHGSHTTISPQPSQPAEAEMFHEADIMGRSHLKVKSVSEALWISLSNHVMHPPERGSLRQSCQTQYSDSKWFCKAAFRSFLVPFMIFAERGIILCKGLVWWRTKTWSIFKWHDTSQ